LNLALRDLLASVFVDVCASPDELVGTVVAGDRRPAADRTIRATFCVREPDPMESHGVIGDERVRWVNVVAAADDRRVTSTPQTFV
jgi:hypothetical protein